MPRLIFFLGLLAFGHACWPIEDLDPNGGAALSKGKPASFARGEAKVMVRPSAKGDGKLGLYLMDEVEDTVAGVTLHQVNATLFVSFYERRQGILTKVFTQFIEKGELFFKSHAWTAITVSHIDDVMKVGISSETYYENWKTVKGLVRIQHRLPLRIYAKALLGPAFSVTFHYPGEEVAADTTSSYLGNGHYSTVYIVPHQDFRIANVILQVNGNYVVYNLTSNDLIPEHCNLLKYHVRRDGEERWLELYLPQARRCTRFTEEQLNQEFNGGYLVTNAPVRLVFAKGKAKYHMNYGYYETTYEDNQEMKTVATPMCDSKEEIKCRVEWIGSSSHSSELVPMETRVDFAVQPSVVDSRRIINFGVWLQEVGHLLAGVQVFQEGDDDVQLNFYQFLNDSYQLRHSKSLDGVKLDHKNVTSVVLTYNGNEVEMGIKTSPEGQWYNSKTAMALENQLPLSAFLWSREEVIVTKNCPPEDLNFNEDLQPVTSSPRLNEIGDMITDDAYFRPTPNFKVGALILSVQRRVLHIEKTDIIPDKWNRISTNYWDNTFITMPTRDSCPVMIESDYYRPKGFIYTNPDTEWLFEKPSPELGEIVRNERCALNCEPGCLITTIGLEMREHFDFEVDRITFSPNKSRHNGEKVLFIIISDGPLRLASLLVTRDEGFFLVSEDLGFKSKIADSRDHFPSKISLTRRQDGHVEFVSWFPDVADQLAHISFTSNKTLPAPTEGYALTYAFVNRDSFESAEFKIVVIDDGETSIITRSSSNWTTSLTFHLREATGTDEGNLQVAHGSSANSIRVTYTREEFSSVTHDVPDVTVRTNQWFELTLRIFENVLRVGLRTQEEPTWRNLEFETKKFYPRPLLAVIESLHRHDVILNCKRENGQFAVADDRSPSSVLPVASLGSHQPEMAFAHLEKTATSPVPVGRRSAILVWAKQHLDFALLQFSHRGGRTSTITLSRLEFHPAGAAHIYFDNTDQDEGITRVELPTATMRREVTELSSHGPVESVQVFATQESVWLFNSCGQVPQQELEPEVNRILGQFNGGSNTDGVTEMAAFPGDSALFIWSEYGQIVIVYLYHENGKVSIRDIAEEMTSKDTVFLRLHNVEDEETFAYMTGTSNELEILDHSGPVRNITVVLEKNRNYCVILLEACQPK